MKRLTFACSFLFIVLSAFSQAKHGQKRTTDNSKPAHMLMADSVKSKIETKHSSLHHKLIQAVDTLNMSDYMMSIERVNDNLNAIRDSAKLKFEVVGMERRIDYITNDISLIRLNIRDRHAIINNKNLYLYQSFASNLDDENDRLNARLIRMYNKVYRAKLRLKTVLSDSVFRRLYADTLLRNTFDKRLVRLERKWARTDTLTRANVDSLNALKIKIADNSMNLSNMLNMMDARLDKSGQQLFGPEINYLWKRSGNHSFVSDTSRETLRILGSEQKAIGYYFSQTSGERAFVLLLGILLFMWLFFKRKLMKVIREQKDSFDFLHLQYLNNHPVLALLIVLLCLMPFFDAYAPTSYSAIEFFLLLLASTVIFFKKEENAFTINWLTLLILYVSNIITYLLIAPTLAARLWLLVLHAGIFICSFRFYRKLSRQLPYYKGIKVAAVIAMILSVLAVLCNLFGRFSLSGIFGIAAIFAVTQAVVLPVFIETIIETILLQLQSSRMKKGVDKSFDTSSVIKKIKMPLIIVAVLLWLIMLTSNLNIYHSISNLVTDLLTTTRNIGSISYKLISVLWFFVIIWFAHVLQRLISFLFGETGKDTEDITPGFKGNHSRLLITRLLVLIGGYLLAIAASGLPIDKLTFLLGALGVGIGMGLQNVVNNFVSGIILIFDGTFKIGDVIEVNGQAGKVKEIGLRASTLNTADGADVIIPNGNILSQNIVNWTFSNDQKRVILEFRLLGKELDANVINEVINETIKNIPNVISQKKPVILYTKVTPDTCSLTINFWSTISNVDQVKSEAMLRLNAAFVAKNIGFR
jgi:potassium-dependent mechanosensitive channel